MSDETLETPDKPVKESAASRSIPCWCRSAAAPVTACPKAPPARGLCYASGVEEAEAVRETVAILKQAELAPLDVTGYGTLEEREALGHEIDDEERALMERALAENSVIVAQMTPFYGDEKG